MVLLLSTVFPHFGITAFNEYAEQVFIPHLEKQLQGTARLDVVWDTYTPDSLKDCTREKRGKGVRTKVSAETKLPRIWMDFLRDSLNKEELFSLLTSKAANYVFPQGRPFTSQKTNWWSQYVRPVPCQTAMMKKPTPGLWFM